jgi:BolA family transcriptional regulator, general stress-responsive regulator
MNTVTDRVGMIRKYLTSTLHPVHLEIVDESHKHVGHAGAAQGGGHFRVNIVSASFNGKSLVERHRMVYASLSEAMQHEIHALSIKAITPDEYSATEG